MTNSDQNSKDLYRAIDAAGTASEYDKQAFIFLSRTGTKIEARFLGCLPGHFGPKDEPRDVYEVRIARGTREYVFKYGNSIHNTETRLSGLLGANRTDTMRTVRYDNSRAMATVTGSVVLGKWLKKAEEWSDLNAPVPAVKYLPRPYDILTALTKYEPEADVDEFALEYGFTKPSEALKAHTEVWNEYRALQALYSDEEIAALQLIA